MKWIVAALLVIALAVPATAGNWVNIPAVMVDTDGRPIINTFYQSFGDSVEVVYSTRGHDVTVAPDSIDISIDGGGYPGWIMFQFPEETTTLTAWFRFKESVDGLTHSYTWGDWAPLFLGGEYREKAFNMGLWDSCRVVVVGSGDGLMSVYYTGERISD